MHGAEIESIARTRGDSRESIVLCNNESNALAKSNQVEPNYGHSISPWQCDQGTKQDYKYLLREKTSKVFQQDLQTLAVRGPAFLRGNCNTLKSKNTPHITRASFTSAGHVTRQLASRRFFACTHSDHPEPLTMPGGALSFRGTASRLGPRFMRLFWFVAGHSPPAHANYHARTCPPGMNA